ncbi:hypothetical protein [Aquimarina algicola]|uniref:Uncharacterized protein n=1 Tax=Aquimarina algicola TaxID=2589995 RepID=A0A504JF51_9FLAO|nr:hypothetical protein [Aquimarina algicola]TPN87095.1 hypothetical protein FHK87_05755 [Aquimarina algicola]
MPNANEVYEKLSKIEKSSILKTIDTIVDMKTPLEISKRLADQLHKKFLSLGIFKASNVLFIEAEKSVFQKIISLRFYRNIRSMRSNKLKVKSGF